MCTAKFRLKHNILNSAVLAALLAITGNVSAQTIPDNCHALIDIRNDLWLVKPDGSPMLQLTHDGKQKNTVGGISPDGKLIAYMDEMPNDFTQDNLALINLNGTLISETNLHTEEVIIGLEWISAKLLQAAGHISPRASAYHFVEVPSGGLHPVSLQELPSVEGGSCAVSTNYRDMACIRAENIDLNDNTIYSSTGALASAIELQTLDIAVGKSITTSTVPPFKLEVTGITDNQPELKVTTSDELWNTHPNYPNFTMAVLEDPDLPNDAPPNIYGFTATIKSKGSEKMGAGISSEENQKAAIVTVRVQKSVTGGYSLEGELAWSPNGRRIATVEKNDLGKSFLVLLNREASEEENNSRNEGQSQDQNQNGIVDVREDLPISGPISRIEFTSDTHIRVVGETQVFEQDIPAYGKVRDTTNYTITDALPKQFVSNDRTIPIYGWVCQ